MIIVENLTLTALTDYLRKHFSKKTGSDFTISDVQGYVNRGKLPDYLGGYNIKMNEEIKSVKLYKLIQ